MRSELVSANFMCLLASQTPAFYCLCSKGIAYQLWDSASFFSRLVSFSPDMPYAQRLSWIAKQKNIHSTPVTFKITLDAADIIQDYDPACTITSRFPSHLQCSSMSRRSFDKTERFSGTPRWAEQPERVAAWPGEQATEMLHTRV